MKNDTKNKILETAQILFNEEGYEHITMRRIAEELNISVGNLTYHFKYKRNILEALMRNLELFTKVKPAQDLSYLNLQLKKMLQSLIDNRFFFISDELANLSPEFAEKNRKNVTQLEQILFEILQELTALGFFNPEFDETAQKTWIKIIMLAHLSWIKLLDLNHEPQTQLQEFLTLHWISLTPYLSEDGKKQMKNMFRKA